jgi:23S rRNA (uracil1939-C5)-methyltransferase
MTDSAVTGTLLEIERLGQRGEGVAHGERSMVYIPYAVPGDVARVEVDGERGRLLEVVSPSPDRIASANTSQFLCGVLLPKTRSKKRS